MPAHKWTFKSRFRANAYGWKGTALASKRLKEAVSEIKQVARTEPIVAADGAVALMERIWPSLQGIDGSFGALGAAVNRTLETLIPVIVDADAKTRRGRTCASAGRTTILLKLMCAAISARSRERRFNDPPFIDIPSAATANASLDAICGLLAAA